MIILYSKMQKKKTEFPVEKYIVNGQMAEYQAGEQRTQDIFNSFHLRMDAIGAENRRLGNLLQGAYERLNAIEKIVKSPNPFIRKKIRNILVKKKGK